MASRSFAFTAELGLRDLCERKYRIGNSFTVVGISHVEVSVVALHERGIGKLARFRLQRCEVLEMLAVVADCQVQRAASVTCYISKQSGHHVAARHRSRSLGLVGRAGERGSKSSRSRRNPRSRCARCQARRGHRGEMCSTHGNNRGLDYAGRKCWCASGAIGCRRRMLRAVNVIGPTLCQLFPLSRRTRPMPPMSQKTPRRSRQPARPKAEAMVLCVPNR